ncbi:MAG TPA: cyclin family protein, partial [Chitinophagaceae bacterium]|nr:cyclin family protein [Chitinophagaceae bacterium]
MRVIVIGIAVSSLFLACKIHNEKLKSSTIDKDISNDQTPETVFDKDTQFVLYSGEITLPKGWRVANDDTILQVADATSRYRFHNKNGKLIFLQYGLGTIGNPSEPNVQSAIFR